MTTMALPNVARDGDRVRAAIDRAVAALFRVQRADGSWVDHLSSSALATAPALLALHLADPARYAAQIAAGCAWLRATQHADGSWGDAVIDAGTLNATAMALPALMILDPRRSAEAIARAQQFIDCQGGMAAIRDFQRCSLFPLCLQFMAMAGLCEQRDVHRMPLELILFPRRMRRWFAVTSPCVYAWGLMHARIMTARGWTRWLQRLATPRALGFLAATQGSNGGYEESAVLTATVYIGLTRANLGHDVAERCLDWLLSTRRPDGSWPIDRDLELSATTYVLGGLGASGHLDDARLERTAHWIAAQQMQRPWDVTGAPAGGWAWAQPSGWPDSDDTAGAALALARLGRPEHGQAVRRGCEWLLAMQNRDGSWSGFLRDGKLSMDGPCAALSAHAVISLVEAGGYGLRDRCIAKALGFFSRVQTSEGAIPNLWFRNYTCGTAWVLGAYAALGLGDHPVAVRCIGWLLRNQNGDGGWGGAREVASTVEETAWALTALRAAGLPSSHARLEAAAEWLMARQAPDGTWAPSVICFYYTQLRYSSDQMANGFALEALGRFAAGRR
jgi:squalene-hopene/tetraprenyl-beta-curcumene cyclase